MIKKLFITIIGLFFFIGIAQAADVKLTWDPSPTATGYKVYISTDCGETWDYGTGQDVGNMTVYTYTNVPDTGLILFRVSAYNGNNEAVRYDAMLAHCSDCLPPNAPAGVGIE